MGIETKVINEHQQEMYIDFELSCVRFYFIKYKDIFDSMPTGKKIEILDVGGGAGYFVKEIVTRYPQLDLHITLLDSTRYETWDELEKSGITCVQASADEADIIFEKNTFDYIFANRVYHHFICGSFKETNAKMLEITTKFHTVLKNDGRLCIMDHLVCGAIIDKFPSYMIYTFTTYKGFLTKLFRKLGAHSAGVGVCMRSEKMWLKMIEKSGFNVEKLTYGGDDNEVNKLMRIALMIGKYMSDSVFVLVK